MKNLLKMLKIRYRIIIIKYSIIFNFKSLYITVFKFIWEKKINKNKNKITSYSELYPNLIKIFSE